MYKYLDWCVVCSALCVLSRKFMHKSSLNSVVGKYSCGSYRSLESPPGESWAPGLWEKTTRCPLPCSHGWAWWLFLTLYLNPFRSLWLPFHQQHSAVGSPAQLEEAAVAGAGQARGQRSGSCPWGRHRADRFGLWRGLGAQCLGSSVPPGFGGLPGV